MADMDLMNIFSGYFGNMLQFLGIVVFLGLLAFVILFAFRSGLIVKRPHKVIVAVKRQDGYVQILTASGRYLKSKDKEKTGKYEIFYGLNDYDEIDAPEEDFVNQNTIGFVRTGRDSYAPMKIMIDDDDSIKLKTSSSSAMKLAFSSALKANHNRFEQKNWLLQNPHIIAFVVAALIIGLAMYFTGGKWADGINNAASAMRENAETWRNIYNSTRGG